MSEMEWAWVVCWWRRVFGPSRRELREAAETWRRRCEGANRERERAHGLTREMRRRAGELKSRVDVLEAQLASAQRKILLGAEPVQKPGCTKVRLHRREEAEQWAVQVAAGTSGKREALHAYQCRTCPRSPVTMGRYWHVGHLDTAEGKAAKRESLARTWAAERGAKAEGRTIGQQIDPSVIEKLRQVQ